MEWIHYYCFNGHVDDDEASDMAETCSKTTADIRIYMLHLLINNFELYGRGNTYHRMIDNDNKGK